MRRIAAVAAVVVFASFALAQDAPKFGDKVEVNLVLVDAVVTDSGGHQILGLDKDDFTIKEDGQPQAIESVDYFTNRRLLNAPEQNAGFKVERVREERYFVFFFDKPTDGQLIDRLMLARTATEGFIANEMLPTDRVAIVGHDVRLKVYSDFTADKSQLGRALDQVITFGLGLKKPAEGADDTSILHNIDRAKMINKTGTVYEALQVLGDGLRPIKARKNLILFSAGIHEPGEDVRNGVLLNKSRYYDPMIHSLNAANVTVYPMNLQENSPPLPIFHQSLESLAADTNGEYFRHPVSFKGPVKGVEQATNGYYLITYYSHKPKGTSGYQKVQVSLRNPEFKVKAREGYTFGEAATVASK